MFFNSSWHPQATIDSEFMLKLRTRRSCQAQRGLSLIELLVAISVLGFLTAIATPIVSNVFNRATKSAAQQTAKQIAQAAVAATAAGNTEIMESGSLDNAILIILEGLAIEIGQETTRYELGLIDDHHLDEARKYLGWQNGVILFCPQGVPH